MTLVRWGYDVSPFSDKVRRALRLKGLDYEWREVLVWRTGRCKHVSPTGRFPVLDDGGTFIHDSTDILRHLDACFPDPPLYPADPRVRRHLGGLGRRKPLLLRPHHARLAAQPRLVRTRPAAPRRPLGAASAQGLERLVRRARCCRNADHAQRAGGNGMIRRYCSIGPDPWIVRRPWVR